MYHLYLEVIEAKDIQHSESSVRVYKNKYNRNEWDPQRTASVKKTKFPQYEQTFKFTLSPLDELVCELWNKKRPVGRVRFKVGLMGDNSKQWFAIHPIPKKSGSKPSYKNNAQYGQMHLGFKFERAKEVEKEESAERASSSNSKEEQQPQKPEKTKNSILRRFSIRHSRKKRRASKMKEQKREPRPSTSDEDSFETKEIMIEPKVTKVASKRKSRRKSPQKRPKKQPVNAEESSDEEEELIISKNPRSAGIDASVTTIS
mmetsp:Transcript_8469/g.9466  ORF Transcript_8469/g.9466 Transcript_8469/m.9466 type:complete len:259 (-) Transcript_8469:275-1051(-)